LHKVSRNDFPYAQENCVKEKAAQVVTGAALFLYKQELFGNS
jgi:hypothetical protein